MAIHAVADSQAEEAVLRVSNKQTMRVLSGQCMAKFKDTNLAHT
jgi:hypothetical protein